MHVLLFSGWSVVSMLVCIRVVHTLYTIVYITAYPPHNFQVNLTLQ